MIRSALVTAVLVCSGCAYAHAEDKKLDLRSAELYVKTLEGKATKLAPYAGKKLTLVNLWATWCGPCRQEMPDLERVHQKYEARGFRVVGVDINEGAALVKGFLAKHKVGYPILLSTEQKTVAALGNLEALPTSILIGDEGEVIEVMVGALDVPHLTELVDQKLAETTKPKK